MIHDKVSIVLPVFNGEKFLRQSILSCLKQTHKNIELIIVNDCSTDNTKEIAASFVKKDKRVLLINNSINKKLPASLNIGHNKATGNYITWTSDDNLYEKNAIEILLNEINKNKVDIVYSNLTLININKEKIRSVEYLEIENLIFGNQIGACFLYKRDVYIRNKRFNENLFLVEDYDFWLNSLHHSKFLHIHKELYKYRKHKNNLTTHIRVNNEYNKLWKKNLYIMYQDFTNKIGVKNYKKVAKLLLHIITYKDIELIWIKKNYKTIKTFINLMSKNSNFSSQEFKRNFIKKIITNAAFQKTTRVYKIKYFIFILKHFTFNISKQSIKIIIKRLIYN